MKIEIGKYTNKNVEVIPFGIDLKKFKIKEQPSDEYFTIGIVKSLEEIYGIDLLINAFKVIRNKYMSKKLRLLIVGDGSKKQSYMDLVSRLQLNNDVEFAGKIDQEKIPFMHSRIDLFVSPSYSESFGVSVLEAEATGVPVVVTRVGGLKEVMEVGKTGLMVEPGNVDAIVNAISFFIDNPERLREYGKNGRKFVEDNYDWSKNLIQISDIYDRF